MISEKLKLYLLKVNQKSKFQAILSDRGGYISFSNTSDKFFTLGLDSFIITINDFIKNLNKFKKHESYIEREWRDLGAENYSDPSVNAMSTVQTKPLFTTLSKLICWANEFDINNYSDNNINLEQKALEKTLIELEKLAESFRPIKQPSSGIKIILENKILRKIIFDSYKYVIKEFGEEKVLNNYDLKETKIESRDYKGLSLDKYFGFETIIGLFETEQDEESLKSSGTPRFLSEKINTLDNPFSYFTSQWNAVENGRGLTLGNFNVFLKEISNSKLKIIKENDIYKLIYRNLSPLKKTEQIIFYGAPGTGKSYKVDNKIKDLNVNFYERITFHPEFDHASFVGSYKPKSEKDEDGKDVIKYQFVPQAFTNIYERAWNDLDNQYYLVIEEINRGNCAEIFGDIFQILDRNSNYSVSPSNELKEHLNKVLTNKDGINNGLKLPPNLSILATMNTSDQSLFPMDSAFKRRWDWEYIPICYKEKTEEDEKENESFFYKVYLDDKKTKYFNWINFIEKINEIIEANENLGMDKCIGNYFIKSDSKEIELKDFVNKAIFYLWNDVFKDEDSSKSIFEKGVTFEKFFPIKSKGKDLVEKILLKNNIETLPKDI